MGAPYAVHTIKLEPVPDRKQVTALKKSLFYEKVLKKNSWWINSANEPYQPFTMRRDGAITVKKADLDDVPEGNGKSSNDIYELVEEAYKEAGRKSDKVLESDGPGIALMLESMSQKPASVEDERRALIISNFTRTWQQKLSLAKLILTGELALPGEVLLPESCYADLIVVVYHHSCVRIMWRGEPADADEECSIPAAH